MTTTNYSVVKDWGTGFIADIKIKPTTPFSMDGPLNLTPHSKLSMFGIPR